ncbi:MAG: hypothetical protein V4662_00975 [Verrucomicrobiota bacterium]
MKAIVLPLLIGLLSATLAQAAPAPIAKITTLAGKTYRQCHIVKVHPDGVSFRHANGAARILFTDLSKDWRDRLGYSPSKAAAYKQERADKAAAEKVARAKYEEARYNALAAAADRARIQALGQEAQARAAMALAMQQQQQMYPNQVVSYNGPSVVPVLPALGTVHDSGGVYGRYDRYRAYPYGYTNGSGYAYPNGYGYPGYPYNGSYGVGLNYNGYGASYHHSHGGWGGNYCRPGSTFRVSIRR